MFQYAFGLAASRRLGTEFVMDEDKLRTVFLVPARSRPAEVPAYPIVRFNNDDYDEPEDVLGQLEDGTHYKGFFQSERFFADAAAEVRAAFRLRPEHEDAFRNRYDDLLRQSYICCHVRRTDYLTFVGGVALPMAYYRRCLSRLAPARGTPIVFVGDDLEDARSEFASLEGVRFERNEEVVDLQLLMHADALVVSNSSFAWWGAWLNSRPGKRVFAPRDWLGFNHRTGWHKARRAPTDARRRRSWELPHGVIPGGWIQVRVRRPWRERIAPGALKSSLALLAHNTRALVERRR